MVSRTHVSFKADDRSYFAILKKEIHLLAVSAGFSEKKIAEIDIVVAEIVSNLVKHAGGGQLLVKLIEADGIQGIEFISMDNGPGMTDVTRMVADGVSTKNTLGHGLGAMKRLSDVFQVYSQREWGTIILLRIFDKELSLFRKPGMVDIKSLLLAKPGEQACGDGFCSLVSERYVKLFLGDGLGHGKDAEEAVVKAEQAFLECGENDPVHIIRHINMAVKKTRGLVGVVGVFDFTSKSWRFCGVGNIATKIAFAANARNYMSYNGIIGLNVPNTLNSQEIAYERGQQVILSSDGLKTRWEPMKFPAIHRYDLSVLNAAILKDSARYTDDMSVATCKINL